MNKYTPVFSLQQIIGSSLLIMYDTEICGAWMIDFAKTIPVDNGLSLDHRTPWKIGTHEDGYLSGLDNLIQVSLVSLCDFFNLCFLNLCFVCLSLFSSFFLSFFFYFFFFKHRKCQPNPFLVTLLQGFVHSVCDFFFYFFSVCACVIIFMLFTCTAKVSSYPFMSLV